MNIQELKNKLPHGSIRNIAKKAKLSESKVSKFLSGIGVDTKGKILKATEEYVLELKENETNQNQKIKHLAEIL